MTDLVFPQKASGGDNPSFAECADGPQLLADVTNALHELLDANAGDTIHTTTRALCERRSFQTTRNRVGTALAYLADTSPTNGLVVERANPGAGARSWAVRRARGDGR